jgi:hypothetical protein
MKNILKIFFKKTMKKQWSKGVCVVPYSLVGPLSLSHHMLFLPSFKSKCFDFHHSDHYGKGDVHDTKLDFQCNKDVGFQL